MKKTLILAIAGAGKTYLAENFENVVDFESLYHLWEYDEDIKDLPIDMHKGNPKRKPNVDFPSNYIEDIKEELEREKIVLTPGMPNNFYALCVVGDLGRDYRVIIAMPHEEDFETLAERFRKRRNSESFVELVRENFKKMHEYAKNYKNGEYLVIGKGKFLKDALIEYGIELKAGKGEVKENRNAGKHLKERCKNKKSEWVIDIPSSTIIRVKE